MGRPRSPWPPARAGRSSPAYTCRSPNGCPGSGTGPRFHRCAREPRGSRRSCRDSCSAGGGRRRCRTCRRRRSERQSAPVTPRAIRVMSDHPWVEVGRGAERSPTGRPERLAGPEARLYGSKLMSAPTIDELEVADDPERWAALGFEVLDQGCQLGGVRVSLLGTKAGSGIVGWSLRDLESTDLDG